jgi:predicted MPP superfamily phosphohydrolase
MLNNIKIVIKYNYFYNLNPLRLMKVRYFSDLHLEFIKPNKIEKFIRKIPSGLDEICILAGVIGNPYCKNYDIFMKFISKNFKKTFYITGNHEYYNKTYKTIQETNEFLKDYFQPFDNISFLNNTFEIYENHCFIGTTLWSKIINPNYEINVVSSIPNFNYQKYNKLNKICVDFLQDSIQNNENCIVITHHVPSYSLINVKYKTLKMNPYNQWFHCNMDDVIENNLLEKKIKYWVYGHTHTPSTIFKNGIDFLCNPIGYPNENSIIDFSKSFSIQ